MSDARFREIERRWKATPSQEHTLQYLYELVRVGYDIELGLLDADLLRSYREQLQNDLRLSPLQRISILGRGLHEVMHDIQSYRHEEALAGIPQELIDHYINVNVPQVGFLARRANLAAASALYRALQAAIPDVNLADEYDFEVISLSWVPVGVPIRAGSLANALYRRRVTVESYLLAVIRTSYVHVVHDDLQDTNEEILSYRYYSLYYQFNQNTWTPLPRSGYVFAGEVPKYLGLRFNHGLSIYEIFGDLDEESDDAESSIDEINAAEDAVTDYRNQIAGTISQTFLDIWEERGFISVRLVNRFTEDVIASWEDEDVISLINDGFFHGPVNAEDQGEFHRSVYEYAEQMRLLPWQQQGEAETGHLQRNPTPYTRSWYAALGRNEPTTTILAFGTYEALSKAALHYGVTYNEHSIEIGTTTEGPSVPMLTVRTHDGRFLQIWQKARGNPIF